MNDAGKLHQEEERNPQYLILNENRELLQGPRTIVCTGLGRSGTSAVASLVEFLGVWLGVKPSSRNRENVELRRALNEGSEAAKHLIAEYDAQFPVWGFKAPGARKDLEQSLPLFRNPLVIVPHRDVIGRMGRQILSGGHEATLEALRRGVISQRRLLEALQPITAPQLHMSFSLVADRPEEALAVISDFVGVPVPAGDVREHMTESQERYLAGAGRRAA
jgi:hypothetical protein